MMPSCVSSLAAPEAPDRAPVLAVDFFAKIARQAAQAEEQTHLVTRMQLNANMTVGRPSTAPRLFVYSFPRTCPPFILTAAPAEWEPRMLALLKRISMVVDDPREADLFLVDACLTNIYFGGRTRKHSCAQCAQLEGEILRTMRRVGRFWDEEPHRHILTHLECPRVGAPDPIDAVFPVLWDARPTLVVCGQNSRHGTPDTARQIHTPYAVRHTLLLPVLPSSKRTVDLFYAGTFAAAYPRAWMRDSMRNASVISEFSSRDPSELALEAARSASRTARVQSHPLSCSHFLPPNSAHIAIYACTHAAHPCPLNQSRDFPAAHLSAPNPTPNFAAYSLSWSLLVIRPSRSASTMLSPWALPRC